MVKKKSFGDYVFDIVNGLIMIFLMLLTAYPMYYVIIASKSKNILYSDKR